VCPSLFKAYNNFLSCSLVPLVERGS
jgi:hypothetical protein